MRLRRNMTVLERQKMRAEILDDEVARAQRRAQELGRTLTCIRGMQAWGETARQLHGNCTGEQPGGAGCLCECHDENRSGVESGTAIEIGNDGNESS